MRNSKPPLSFVRAAAFASKAAGATEFAFRRAGLDPAQISFN